jgi:hypothetical protein
LDFRQWWLVRAARLGWWLSLKLGLGFLELILMGALGVREGLIVCRMRLRVILHNFGVFCKGYSALLK